MTKAIFDAALLQARLDEFDQLIAKTQNPGLVEKYKLARDLTNTAGWAIKDLGDAAKVHEANKALLTEAQHNVVSSSRSLIEEAKELAAKIKKEKDPKEQLALETEARALVHNLNGKEISLLVWDLGQGRSLKEYIQPLMNALTIALKPNHNELTKEAAFSGAEFGVHFVPLFGPFIAGGMALARLAELEKRKAESVDSYLNYIDAYCKALSVWCESAEETIKHLERPL